MCTMPVTYCDDPADPQVRQRIHEEWRKEELEHEKQAVDREIVKARWTWEDEQHVALLREWERERTQHEQEVKERTRREDVEHAARFHEWERERVQHEWELKERAQREEEERKRMDLFWGRVEAHQCKTYGTREYTAVLMNLPVDCEWRVQACKATPLEIHGIARLPKSCEDSVRRVCRKTWG